MDASAAKDTIKRQGFESYADIVLGEEPDRRSGGLWLQRNLYPKPGTHKGTRHCIAAANYFWGDGQLDRAIRVLEVALREGLARYGSSDPDVLVASEWPAFYLCEMAEQYEDDGEPARARELAQRAQLVECDEKATRADETLARILKHAGEFDESAQLQRKVLTRLMQQLGPSDLATIQSMLQLSNVLYLREEQGDMSEALVLAEQACSRAVSAFGQEHPTSQDATELLSAIREREDD